MATEPPILHFDEYALDRVNRRLLRGGEEVEIGSRYFDALAMLVEARGDLITKQRFMDEVWRGIPVTDEALTQCIRTLRRALHDDAAAPRFIATVPKHGYRFVGTLGDYTEGLPAPTAGLGTGGRIAAAATIGGALAGAGGGLLYALLLSAGGAASSGVMLTIISLCLAVGVLGGAGVGIGMGLACALTGMRPVILVAGGALGGLVIGAIGRVVGLDLFNVLAGVGIGPVTGLLEGTAIGAQSGAACALALRFAGWRGGLFAGLLGAGGGMLIAVAGGRLMAGSLALLDQTVAEQRLQMDVLGRGLGEEAFGPATLLATSALESAIFVTVVALAVRRA